MFELTVDAGDALPIWRQIEAGVRRLVATGVLPTGSAVPSVRELAKSLRINPATVAKAYQRLAEAQVLTVRRGEGTFVSDSPPALSKRERDRIVTGAAESFVTVLRTAGATREQAAEAALAAWDRLFVREKQGERR